MKKINTIILLLAVYFLCQGEVFVIEPARNAVMHNEWGLYYMKIGYYDTALSEFKLAIALNPNSEGSSAFYNNAGLVYFKLGDYKTSEKYFVEAIKQYSDNVEYYENLIKSRKESGTLGGLSSAQGSELIKNRYNSRACLILGLINKNYGNKELAIKYFREFKRLEPDLNITKQIDRYIKELSR